ncbi:hypothetical protein [Wenyingzhuangia sp. IMCC45574]
MNFWQLMVRKDDFICSIANSMVKTIKLFNKQERKAINTNKDISSICKGKNVLIVLNSPSVKEQDLNKFEGWNTIFVNRGFKHPLYKKLRPKFHFFIDPKMISGEWSVEWLDEILQMVPDITFVMPASWANHPKFKDHIDKGTSIYWVALQSPFSCVGVGGFCIEFAIKQCFKNIYFTGFEATGIAHEIINSTSHFYGVNDENNLKTSSNYIIDLLMHSRHLNDLHKISKKAKKENISIINLTKGGVLDMFYREEMIKL